MKYFILKMVKFFPEIFFNSIKKCCDNWSKLQVSCTRDFGLVTNKLKTIENLIYDTFYYFHSFFMFLLMLGKSFENREK